MRKLIKWTFFAGLAAIVVGFVCFGRSLSSYARTAYQEVRKAAHNSVPIEFQLKRAKNLIREIDPEIKEARTEVARAEVELKSQHRKMSSLKEAIASGESRIKRQQDYLGGASRVVPVSWEKRAMNTRVRHDLERTFDLYKTHVKQLESMQGQVERQEKILEAARTKLHAVRREKQKLEDLVMRLETRKAQLDALAASVPNCDLDTSSLAEARKLIEQIEKDLDIHERLIQQDLYLASGVPVEQGEERDVLAEIDEYFKAESSAPVVKLRAIK